MHPIIETKRLFLREFNVNDAQNMLELNADPEVLQYTGDIPFSDIEEAKQFLKDYNDYQRNGFGRWTVIEKSSEAFIGWCGLKLNEEGFIDLGYRFFKQVWGSGFATEAAEACLKYGFDTLGISEIIGRTSAENIASCKVLEKIGMQYWKKDICNGIENARYYRISRNK